MENEMTRRWNFSKYCLFCIVILLTATENSTWAESVSREAQKYMNRGMAAVEMSKSPADYDDAIREFEQAARLAPRWPAPYFNLGYVQNKIGKYQEALNNYRKYLVLVPDAPEAAQVQKEIDQIEYRLEKVLEAEKIRNWWKLPSSSHLPRPFLNFYEQGSNDIPKKQRHYKTQFSKSTSRYINWELNLSHPAPGKRIDFEIEAVYSRPDGNVMAKYKSKSYVKSEWTYSYHGSGWGWKTPGQWPRGKYRVEIYIKGEKVTSGSFEIVR
jgi:tetratricopeptide (TPR) repeat protein